MRKSKDSRGRSVDSRKSRGSRSDRSPAGNRSPRHSPRYSPKAPVDNGHTEDKEVRLNQVESNNTHPAPLEGQAPVAEAPREG